MFEVSGLHRIWYMAHRDIPKIKFIKRFLIGQTFPVYNLKVCVPKGQVAVSLRNFCVLTQNLVSIITGTSCLPHKNLVTAHPSIKSSKQFYCVPSAFAFFLNCVFNIRLSDMSEIFAFVPWLGLTP